MLPRFPEPTFGCEGSQRGEEDPMKPTNRLAHVVAIVATVLLTCTFASSALAADCPELTGRWPYGSTWRSPSQAATPTTATAPR